MPEFESITAREMLYHAASCAGAAMAAVVWHEGVRGMPDASPGSADFFAKDHALHGSARSYVYELDRTIKALKVVASCIPLVKVALESNAIQLRRIKRFRDSLAHADARLRRLGNRGGTIPSHIPLFVENIYGDEYETTSEDGERLRIKLSHEDPETLVKLICAAQEWLDGLR
jgi:hypothetical protein